MNKREKTLVGTGAVVVVVSVWFALSSSGGGGKTNLLPIDQARSKTAEAKVNMRKLRGEQSAAEPRVRVRAYDKPADQLVATVVGDLQTNAERAGIHLREVRPLRPKLVTDESDTKTVQRGGTNQATRSGTVTHEALGARVPVEVRFKAPFQPNVVRFLYDLENPGGRMVIDKISITSADARFRTVEVSAQITVFTRSSAGTAGGNTGDTSDDRATKG